MATTRKRPAKRRPAPPPPTLTRDLAAGAVQQLPDNSRTPDRRTMRFAVQMAKVRGLVKSGKVKRGAWVPIATFVSPRGASEVARKMRDGDRPVDGKLADWEIEARREVVSGGSKLWVRLR